MAENTAPAMCSDAEWEAAKAAGLLVAPPLTTAQECALHAFAVAMRADLLDALTELSDIVQGLLDKDGTVIDSFTLQPARAAIANATQEKSE